MRINRQEFFDKVATHLFTQGTLSVNLETKECLYRGPNGTKCAIGIFIPDDQYDRNLFEGDNASSVLVRLKYNILPTDKVFVNELQYVHDCTNAIKSANGNIIAYSSLKITNEDDLKNRLRQIAERYKLNSNILETLHLPQ